MRAPVTCRRRQKRHTFPPSLGARIEFIYPFLGEQMQRLELRDISGAGLSFTLDQQLPLLEAGDSIDEVTITVGHRVVDGDLLVMRLTPDNTRGAVCGGLFFPASDEDLAELHALLREIPRLASA
ncbi:MAG: hypothetical protein JSV80_16450 [Acidobacteriota bacterium]|nr:MAG: hypothetical protein JSV80_16450 [Acidobacteriota bacterium]